MSSRYDSKYSSGGRSNGGGYKDSSYKPSWGSSQSWGGQRSDNNLQPTSSKVKGYHPNQDVGSRVFDVDWSREKLEPFTKVFYNDGQSKRSSEEIKKFREEKEILIKEAHCSIPNPFISWDETYFPGYIMQEIKNANFTAPSAIQSQAFPIILSGHDFIGIAKTGSGKTLAFLLPSIVHINAQPTVKKGDGPIVLVLSPTRELAIQIQEQCKKFGFTSKLSSTCVYGGVDKYQQRDDLQRGVDIVIATPGRLLDFLDKRVTNLRRVTYLVLDEADRMLDMGFEPQIRKILGQIRPDRQTLMFSATWPKEVQQMAKDFCQTQPIYIQIGDYENTVNKNIKQITEVLGLQQKEQRLIKYLDTMKSHDKVLVFISTKKNCEMITNMLRRERFPALPLHGDKSQAERDNSMEAFKSGSCRILVATDVASRGLDIKDVSFVINYDMPKNIEDYIHRIGRTGRAGSFGTSISFLTYEEDKKMAVELVKVMRDAKLEINEDLYKLSEEGRLSGKSKGGNYRRRSVSPRGNRGYNTGFNSFREYKDKYGYLNRGNGNQQQPQFQQGGYNQLPPNGNSYIQSNGFSQNTMLPPSQPAQQSYPSYPYQKPYEPQPPSYPGLERVPPPPPSNYSTLPPQPINPPQNYQK